MAGQDFSSGSFPRSGRVLLSGVPWLARAIDKGRMALQGTLGEYVFPCPMDEEILNFLSLSEEEFLGILTASPDDEGVLQRLEERFVDLSLKEKMWCEVFLVRYSRLLDFQDREEGRIL
jgi:hypothetical protein